MNYVAWVTCMEGDWSFGPRISEPLNNHVLHVGEPEAAGAESFDS